ncbi:hypothetical protein Bca4012_007965 [Brassica carinata]
MASNQEESQENNAYPEASKFCSHPLRFIPLLDVVFRDETVVVEESWQPRRGVYHRTPRVELSDEEEVQIQDSHDLDLMEQDDTAWLETPMKDTPNVIETDPVMPSQQSMKDTSRRKRKRNPVDSTLDRIAATMEDRNGILDRWHHLHLNQSQQMQLRNIWLLLSNV